MNQPLFKNIKRRTGEKLNNQITKFDDRLYKIQTEKPLKVTWFQKLWAKLNGYKTKIGALASLATGVMMLCGVTGAPLLIAGGVAGLFDFIGPVHSTLKSQKKYGSKGKFGLEEILKIIIDILKTLLKGIK